MPSSVISWVQNEVAASDAVRLFLGIVFSSRKLGDKQVMLQVGPLYKGLWNLKALHGKVRSSSVGDPAGMVGGAQR